MIQKRTTKQILGLLDTLQIGIDYLSESQSETAVQVLNSSQWALREISQIIQDENITSTQFCRDKLNAVSESLMVGMGPGQGQIAKQRLSAVQKKLLNEPVCLEIAFFLISIPCGIPWKACGGQQMQTQCVIAMSFQSPTMIATRTVVLVTSIMKEHNSQMTYQLWIMKAIA